MKKEKIRSGKYVELVFDLYKIGAGGNEILVHEVTEDEPECIIYGVTQGVIAPLEKALEGLEAGDVFDVVAKADEAFGHHNPEEVVELEREIFEIDGRFDEENIRKGVRLPMATADGQRIEGLVVEVTDEYVKMDFNHQLVDCDVHIKGHVHTVREVTEDDLRPAVGCGCHGGCGGCGGSCGDGEECNCDGGCGG